MHPRPLSTWTPSGADIPAILLAGLVYFLVRGLLVCGAVALHERKTVIRVLKTSLLPQGLVYGALLGLAPLVVGGHGALRRAGAAVRGAARGRLLHRDAVDAARPPGDARRADRAPEQETAHSPYGRSARRSPRG